MILYAMLAIACYLVFASDYMTAFFGPIFGYGDELLALMLGVSAVLALAKNLTSPLSRLETYALYLLMAVMAIGSFCSIYFRYQYALPAMVDALVFVKGFVVYFATRVALAETDIGSIRVGCLKVLRVFAVLLLLAVVVDKFAGVFPQSPSFFGGMTESELWFIHPSRLAFAAEVLFCAIFALSTKNDGRSWMWLALAIGIFTLKQKYLIFVAIAVAVLVLGTRLKYIGRWVGLSIAALMSVVAWVSFDKIYYYFSDESYISGFARAVLTHVSIEIAGDHFPLGSGFGTFGTFVSGEYYSDLYFVYGIDRVYGLTRDDPNFVADVYWPMVLGQFGYIGLLAVMIMMLLILLELVRRFNRAVQPESRRLILGSVLVFTALIIDTSADQIISQNRGVVAFFLIALFANSSAITERNQNAPIRGAP